MLGAVEAHHYFNLFGNGYPTGNGDDSDASSHAMYINTSNHGIAIVINDNTPDKNDNFITFFDGNDDPVGRIEGQTLNDLHNSHDYLFFITMETLDGALMVAEGIACFAQADYGEVGVLAAEGVLKVAHWLEHTLKMEHDIGVSYQSGGADYAEYLEKKDQNELFVFGDIVGIKGGKISKQTHNADHYRVISTNPIVLGNMPPIDNEDNYEKVAFLGQVPVKVIGQVNIGDYILPSGNDDGLGIAKHPDDMLIEDYSRIVGVAWSISNPFSNKSLINTAIGLNNNDLVYKIQQQQEEINSMKGKVNNILTYLESKDPEFKEEMLFTQDTKENIVQSVRVEKQIKEKYTPEIFTKAEIDFSYIEKLYEQKPELFEQAQKRVREYYVNAGVDIEQNQELKRILEEPGYCIKYLKNLSANKTQTSTQ